MSWRLVSNSLSAASRALLLALARGDQLKAHRSLDGDKVHQLQALTSGVTEVIDDALVTNLLQRGLIESNLKFPAASYLLTERGAQIAAELGADQTLPITVRG